MGNLSPETIRKARGQLWEEDVALQDRGNGTGKRRRKDAGREQEGHQGALLIGGRNVTRDTKKGRGLWNCGKWEGTARPSAGKEQKRRPAPGRKMVIEGT